MDKDKMIEPSVWCQEELWRLIYWYEAEVGYIDNPWFPTSVKLTVAADSILLQNKELDGAIELQKERIIVKTRACVLFLSKYSATLHECGKWEEMTGQWFRFDRHVVPFLKIEYVHAEELYKRIRHIFKVLAGHITDKLGF